MSKCRRKEEQGVGAGFVLFVVYRLGSYRTQGQSAPSCLKRGMLPEA